MVQVKNLITKDNENAAALAAAKVSSASSVIAAGHVDESNLKNGAQSLSGKLTVDFGEDGFGSIAPNGQFTPANLRSAGLGVTVTLQGNQYVGTRSDGVKVFEITINDDGNYKFDLFKPLDHADSNDSNDALNINFGVIAKDADGDSAVTAITISVLDDGPVAVNDSFTVDGDAANSASGNVLTNDNVGADANANAVTKVTFGGRDFDVVAGTTTTVTGNFGVLRINANGAYTYTQSNKGDGTDRFVYTITDKDGDTATAALSAKVLGGDDKPVIIQPAIETVDETNLKSNTSVTGKVNVDYGSDAPGSIKPDGTFNLNGLRSQGQAIKVTQTADGYTGTAHGQTIFTLKINATTGAYTFNLLGAVDHPVKTNPNDSVSINFGVKATDKDGDSAATTIRINILDDGPVAVDDAVKSVLNKTPVTGNVFANDKIGADVDTTPLTKVTYKGVDYMIPEGGNRVINGDFGSLTINAQGAYSYVSKGTADGVEKFTYTIADKDGDTDTATFGFNVKSIPATVSVSVNNNVDDVIVKEDSSVRVKITTETKNIAPTDVITLTLTGVKTGWGLEASGWQSAGNGTYKITLPAGRASYDHWIKFTPPAQSDADLTNLKVTASVNRDGVSVTDSDTFNVVTDAVADRAILKTGVDYLALTYVKTMPYLAVNLPISAKQIVDRDGSQVITHVIVRLDGKWENAYVPGANSPAQMGVYLNKGKEISNGVWKIPVMSNDATAALAGLKIIFPKNVAWWESGIFSGKHVKNHITIEAHVKETNLSGKEVDLTDNTAISKTKIWMSLLMTPLVIDMDGDGVELTDNAHGVHFDMNNDGIKDKTSWVDADDALLAIDLNGDGKINNQSELFGDTMQHNDGFENLASYDSNHDGIISSADDRWSELLIWRDLNQDGVSDEGELVSLNDVGIASINVKATETDYYIEDSWISDESTVTFTDGRESKIVDAWFDVDEGKADAAIPTVEAVIDQPTEVQGAIDEFVESTTVAPVAVLDTPPIILIANPAPEQEEPVNTSAVI